MDAPNVSRRTRELLVASVVALALTIVLTWPLAAGFGTSGRIDSVDGRYSIWNISWVAHALTTDPNELWNANFFYPHTGTLAFSEANLVAGVIATPMWLLTHNPYATSNWTILWAFTLAATCMFALVRYLTNNLWGAAVAGVVYAFCSYAFAHLSHIQLLMTFGPPLALLRMHKFVDAPTLRTATWLGVSLAIQALACGYYGLFGGLAVAIGILWLGAWSRQLTSIRFWLLTAMATAIAVALVAPFLIPYLRIQQAGFTRTLDDARLFQATWRSYLASALLVYQWLLPLIGQWHEVLFPGFFSIALAGVAITRAIREPGSLRRASRLRVVGFYVVLAIVALWASLGPDAGLYQLMYRTVPLMSMLRAPSRIGLLVTLATAVLAGIGIASMETTWIGTKRRVLLSLLIVLTLARSTVGPLEWSEAPPTPRAITWLSKLPRGAVAAFPFSNRKDMPVETNNMLQSAWHWQPMLNGYSDFVPDDVSDDLPRLASFPSAESMQLLRQRQTRYVLINWNLYNEQDRQRVRTRLSDFPATLRPMLNDAETSLYELDTALADIRR